MCKVKFVLGLKSFELFVGENFVDESACVLWCELVERKRCDFSINPHHRRKACGDVDVGCLSFYCHSKDIIDVILLDLFEFGGGVAWNNDVRFVNVLWSENFGCMDFLRYVDELITTV